MVIRSLAELVQLAVSENITMGRAALAEQVRQDHASERALTEKMAEVLKVMRESVESGMDPNTRSLSGLTGGQASKLMALADSGNSVGGDVLGRATASALAVAELNAAMGRIVAAPTAGASGILPGVLFTCAKERGWNDEKLLSGLLTAGAIGSIIAANASISGAEHGCQAETGSAAAMAAAALCELDGGSADRCLNAAAIALKNVMGLVCDPVAGLVECPCIKRNALGAMNALISADMALAGIPSLIPFDETVMAMRSVGRLMSPDLRETARGGCAATPTGRAIRKKLGLNEIEEE